MNKTTHYSKILQIERDLRFRRKSKQPAKRHYDNGHSINLQFDEGLNEYARQYSDESFTPVEESYPVNSMQFTTS